MTEETHKPLNREQRRAQKFHRKGAGRQDNLQTQRENNTGFLTEADRLTPDHLDEATTQNETKLTGPGTGGATESSERVTHHEGAHLGNPTKS